MIERVNGREYWVVTEGEGPVLVLLHGFTGSSSTFDTMASHLSQQFRLIKIDLPGHGLTGEVGIVTMEQFCRDLAVIFERLDLRAVSLLGYSLGGRAALSFAMLYPEYIKRLILESTSPGLAVTEDQLARQARDKALAEKIQKEGIESFVSYWESIPLFDSQKKLSEEERGTIRAERLKQTARGLADSLLGMGTGHQPSWWSKLATLSLPVLLITGGDDGKFRDINKKMVDQLPKASWNEVGKAGHAVHLENPKIFAKIVDSFMIE